MFDDVKLIISEIDGVVTNSLFAEDEIGNVLFKVFNYKDFDAINKIKSLGYKFVFLSDDNRINYNMCQRRNIPFYHGRNVDEKVNKLGIIFRKYGFSPDETLYIPSKLTDFKCVEVVANSICPLDVSDIIKKKCPNYFNKNGGEGILVDLLSYLTNNAVIALI